MRTSQLRQEVIAVESEQTQALERQIPKWTNKVSDCQVTTVAQQAAAQHLIIDLKGAIKEAKGWFKSLKVPIDAVKAIILKKEHDLVDPLEEALKIVGAKVLIFDRAQRAEADRLQNELEAKERKRLAQIRAEEKAELAKQIAKAKGEQKQELRQELVELKAAPVEVVVVPVIPKVAVTAGLQTRQNWSAKVTDLAALRTAIGSGTVPWDAMSINQAFLNEWARAAKHEGELCPGVLCVVDVSYVRG